jgi:hypothetical protein
VSLGHNLWVTLIFPGWVLVISIYILAMNLRRQRAGARDSQSLMVQQKE